VFRRIALAFIALLTVLLLAAVLPLGLEMSSHTMESFRFGTLSSARQITAASEETLADHHEPDPMDAAVAQAGRHGDCVAVFDVSRTVVAATACGAASDAAGRALAARVATSYAETVTRSGAWLRVAVPVGDNGEAGVVVLARPADPLDDRVEVMWGWLALTGVGGLALGIALAVVLARWVARPLDALGAAAARIGDGDLDVRVATDQGPAEVRRLAGAFNGMAQRTGTLVHAHRGWVADVSHQLRTPLTALRLRLDLLAGQDEPRTGAELAEDLAGAQEEIARLSRLVDGLLAVARAEAATPKRRAVRIDSAAADRVAAWKPVAREQDVDLRADADGPATALLGDGDLEQVLDNLVANALAAVPAGGHVRVECRTDRHRDADRILLRVVDDGPGMDDRAKQAAFRRFGTGGGPGSGLGLAIVHRLVTADGGDVRLEDAPGGGLTVVVELPAVR
jgi:signal transduction histidine kinase